MSRTSQGRTSEFGLRGAFAKRRFLLHNTTADIDMMTTKKWIGTFLVLLLTMGSAFGAETTPSDASIRELLDVIKAQRMMDSVSAQMDGLMKRSIAEATAGRNLSAAQQGVLDDMSTQMADVFRDLMNWQKMEAMMVDIYERSFTQAEVDGMLTFYKSDAGKAIIEKMPVAMQNTMQAMQSKMSELMPKIRQIQDETVQKMKELDAKQ